MYAVRIGFWSALLSALAFLVFTVCFIGVAVTSPIFMWTNLADYLVYVQENGQFLQTIARVCSLSFALLFVLLLNAIHEITVAEKKVLTRTALSLGIGFAVLAGLFYFVQITAVRWSIQLGQTTGLEQVIQANPLSAVSAMNMLGWTLFLGLASLFLVPVFANGRLQKTIRIAFLLNAIFCLLGGVSYFMQWIVLLFLTINLGMGGAVTVAMMALALYFRRLMVLGETSH